MKTLILDEKTWRCGGEYTNLKNGRGKFSTPSQLINPQGRLCCLGQFSLQLNKSLKKKNLIDCNEPSDLNCEVKDLNQASWDAEYFINTNLSQKAMNINDNTNTTITEKVKKLRELFAQSGYRVVFRKRK